MSAKPWLKAKTAGEAFILATRVFSESWAHSGAQAVIEWHEAQREKVAEYWCVRDKHGIREEHCDDRRDALQDAIRYGGKVVHVTRYRRKRDRQAEGGEAMMGDCGSDTGRCTHCGEFSDSLCDGAYAAIKAVGANAERKCIIAKLRHLIATMVYVSELEDFANELEAET